MKRIVLVTGATSGFGKAIAFRFAQDGDDLIITGRRKDRLEQIVEKIKEQFNVRVLPLIFEK